MSSAFEISGKHVQAALDEAAVSKIPPDVIARAILERVLKYTGPNEVLRI